ncbi:MAG: hypothetical protein A2091_00400 [Desulfuromonadales bacterium GWD2_61_12]|nr:MAG: hypothetical protein A2005_08425 [Desulfuromonadales bacterium GWC2_61_20]OGR32728.1 MAG: hypothetical protein A2091_00400 [Desulfuromonadales bacterium GWD2_61_12]
MKKLSGIGEAGLSLVEMLVAMAVSLVLLGGVYQIFLSSTTTYGTQAELGRLQENGRFAVDILAREIRRAGTPRFSVDGRSFVNLTSNPGAEVPITGNEGGGTVSDTLQLCYENVPGTLARTWFRHDTVDNELERSLDSGTSWQPVIEGVESFQVLYGIDSNEDISVDSYVTATALTPATVVVAVRFGVLLRTVDELPQGSGLDTRTYMVAGTPGEITNQVIIDPVDDRRLRQVFTGTISMRNQLR